MDDIFGETVFSYSRKEAIEDEILVDISSLAKSVGFKIHTAITKTLFSDIDTEEQLPVLLRTFFEKIKRCQGTGEMMSTDTLNTDGKVVTVYLHVGPGDHAEPVLTLMTAQDF